MGTILATTGFAKEAHAELTINITDGGGNTANIAISGTVDTTGGSPSGGLSSIGYTVRSLPSDFLLRGYNDTGSVFIAPTGAWDVEPNFVMQGTYNGSNLVSSGTPGIFVRFAFNSSNFIVVGNSTPGVQAVTSNYSVNLGGSFASVVTNTPSTHIWTPTSGPATNRTILNLGNVAVPEPSSIGVMGFAVILGLLRRRRRALAL